MADLGRATRGYVSAYDRTRVLGVRLRPAESRTLVADFNGALAADRTITAAAWDLDALGTAAISAAAIAEDQRSTSVRLAAIRGGVAALRCKVTLDNDDQLVQMFEVEVPVSRCYGDAPAEGSQSLTVTA